MRKLGLGLAAALLALTIAEKRADAFCGFYVAGADAKLVADATQVVLMREGTKTVLSMQNDYKGPPEKFAMVIPVPVILQKDQVKILPREIFDKVDKLGAPRLVEYWEQDPCPTSGNMWGDGIGMGFGAGGLGLSGIGEGGGGRGLGVKIEAKFAVGEYEIVILSAKDAGGLDTWLKQEGYAIPNGAEPFLKPYVQKGMKFFVAKVDPAKVKFEGGHASLSPIRFHYDAETFTLPVRLGLINSSGTQDLVVNIVAKATRYEAANYPNVTIPTNLDVAEEARGKFGEVYAALFDRTIEKNPKAVVTEYAWDAGTCDPCPGPTLDANDLATLGADVIPHGTDGLSSPSFGGGLSGIGAPRGGNPPSLRQGATKVTGRLPPEVIQRIVRQNYGRFRLCYENGLRTNPTLAGSVTTKFTIGKDGGVSQAADGGGDLASKDVRACIARGFGSLSFPQPEGGDVQVSYELKLAPPEGVDASAPPPAPPPMVFSSGPTPYVITRLHVRYGKDVLGDDLVFKTASAISGGREVTGANGALESGTQPSGSNNFQARYAIRHPWKGAIACKEPRRGVWGGPPATEAGAPPQPGTIAADKIAFAPRGKVTLGSMLVGGENAISGLPGAASASAPSPSASPSSSSDVDGGTTSTAPQKGGCAGCAVSSNASRNGALAFVVALAALARRRLSSTSRRSPT